MKRTAYVLLIVALALLMTYALALAAKGGKSPKASSGVVVVTVDASGKGKAVPMPGVLVKLYVHNGGYVTEATSDANARLEFPSLLPQTTYRMVGYAPDGRLTSGGFTTNKSGLAKQQTLAFYEPAP